MGKLTDWFFGDGFYKNEIKSGTPVVQRSEAEIDAARANEADYGGLTSIVYACARVISEGLALPPVYVQQVTAGGRRYATEHPLYQRLNLSPNLTQTSYDLRQVMGWHAAVTGNAYAWINRSRTGGEILEIVPLDPSEVSRLDPVAIGAQPTFTVSGRPVANRDIWHLKGPSAHRLYGLDTRSEAQRAILLAAVAETFGTDLFRNRAALEGIIGIDGPVDQDQLAALREAWQRRNGPGKRGGVAFLPANLRYQALSATATDSQWLETRRNQVEEICRFFRVSPTKVFHSAGSQSYASVEQAHIAHDQDTDAHWHARFCQSATIALLSEEDRRAGYQIVIDNRDYLRGTANERATYYNAGITGGWMTRNEAREAEGYARSTDPTADQLTPAANVFGQSPDPAE